MAEILLEGRDCETCGTEIRKGALFCYHCGASVAPDVVVTTDTEEEKVSDAWFREDVTTSVIKDEELTDNAETIEETGESGIIDETRQSEIVGESEEPEILVDKTVETEIVEDEPEIKDNETAIEKDAEKEADEKPKLKTAAAMRRKPKQIQKKRVEIVWEEPASQPNIWFLIATLVFAALAIGLWFVAKSLG